MPKTYQVYRDFSGGVNSKSNAKFIKNNELVEASGVLCDERGVLRTSSPSSSTGKIGGLSDMPGNMVIPGRGLFTFKSDYSYSDTVNTITARESEYLCISDKYHSQVDIYGYNDADDQDDYMRQANIIDLGSGTALRAEFYYADGALRVTDGFFNSNNTTKWFGRVGDTTKKKLLGVELDTEWVSLNNAFNSPTVGFVTTSLSGTAAGGDDASLIYASVTSLNGPVSSMATTGDDLTRVTSSSHGLVVGDVIVITGTGTYYNGTYTVVNKASGTFDIDIVFTSDLSRPGSIWTKGQSIDNFQGWTDGVAAAASDNRWLVAYDVAANDVWKILAVNDEGTQDLTTTTNAVASWNTRSFAIYPFPGDGVLLEASQSVGSTEGAWEEGEYEFAQSFIYEGNQESKLEKLLGDNVQIDLNEILYIRVHTSGLSNDGENNTYINQRLIGGRVYIRKVGSNNFWSLLIDMDYRVNNILQTSEHLANTGDFSSLWGGGNGWTLDSTDATYAHHASPADLIQTAANRAEVGLNSKEYIFTYTISGFSETITLFEILGGAGQFANATTALEQSDGTHAVTFTSRSDAVDNPFTINVTSSTSGAFNIDNVSLLLTTPVGDGGTRITTIDDYDDWASKSSQYTIKKMNIESYENLNGFSPSEYALSFGEAAGYGYKTSVVAGQRVFVANVNYIDPDSGVVKVMGDAIFYTPVGKYDTFPSSYKLKIAGNDGDEFTALQYSNGVLFAFKKNSLYLIDISHPNEAAWRLLGKHEGMGIGGDWGVVKTNLGVAWVSKSGLYLFTQNQPVNLISEKVSFSDWVSFYPTDGYGPAVGWDNTSNKLVIVDTVLDASSVRMFDLDTRSWTSGYPLATSPGWTLPGGANTRITNMVTFAGTEIQDSSNATINPNGGIILVGDDNDTSNHTNTTTDLYTLDFSSTTNSAFIVTTKDDDFGLPNIFKKVYEIDIEYITDETNDVIDVKYEIDGNDVPNSSSNALVSNQALSGVANKDNVNILKITPSSPIKCRSFSLRISSYGTATCYLEIVSIAIRYRPIQFGNVITETSSA